MGKKMTEVYSYTRRKRDEYVKELNKRYKSKKWPDVPSSPINCTSDNSELDDLKQYLAAQDESVKNHPVDGKKFRLASYSSRDLESHWQHDFVSENVDKWQEQNSEEYKAAENAIIVEILRQYLESKETESTAEKS